MKKSKSMVKNAKRNFSENFITNLKETDTSTWMKRMKKLGMASFEKENNGWHFLTEDKSDKVLTGEMADYFANISKDFSQLMLLCWTWYQQKPTLPLKSHVFHQKLTYLPSSRAPRKPLLSHQIFPLLL